MGITITNSLALLATHQLNKNQSALNKSLLRLSTGFRINSGADDPAGLIASEMLRGEKATTLAAISNAQRADIVLATADGGLGEISNLLVGLQGLVTASANTAGLGPNEIEANQLQVDSIIASINRIAQATRFGGQPLLDGHLGYLVSGGTGVGGLENLQVHAAQVPAGGVPVAVQVIASAQHATLIYHGTGAGLGGPVRLAISGASGNVELNLASSISAGTMASAVNQFSGNTGIYASASGNDVAFLSSGYGSAQFVSVTGNSPVFQTQTGAGVNGERSVGRDATLAVNGEPVQSRGLEVQVHNNLLNASFLLNNALNVNGGAATFAVTGGGATFALVGEGGSNADSIGIEQVHSSVLGYVQGNGGGLTLGDLVTGGAAALTAGHLEDSQAIIQNAIRDVTRQRGAIGAFRAFNIQSDINFLNIKFENLSSAESAIRDTDFAAETAELTRNQILVQSSQFVLKAAQESQNIILKLLGV